MLKRYESLILNYPVSVLIVCGLVTILFGVHAGRVAFSSSSEKFFIKEDPDRAYYEKAKALFGNDQVVVIALVAPEGETIYNAKRIAQLDRISRSIEKIKVINGLEKVSGVEAVVSITNNISIIAAPYDEKLGRYKKELRVRPLIDSKTLPKSEQDFDKLKKEIDRTPLFFGNLVSRDGRAAAVLAFIGDFSDNSKLYAEIMARIKEIMAREQDENTGIYVVGVPETRVEIEKRMLADLVKLVPGTFMVIVIILIISYRQVRGVVLPMISIVVTTVWAVGAMEMAGIPITLVSMILPPLMLALASSYSIHMMSEYLSEIKPDLSVKEIVKESLDKITVPIVVCSFTTMVGFGSLILNKIPAIQDLGRAALVGIFFAMLVALFVSPASLMVMKKPKKTKPPGKTPSIIDDILDKIGLFTIKKRYAIFTVSIAMGLVCVYGITKVKIDTDFLSFFKKDDPVMQAVDIQTRHLSGAAPFNIVLEANRPDVFKHPAMLKRVEELQRWAETEVKGIDSTVSMADFVKLLSQAFHGNDPAYYKIPDSPVELSQMLFLFASSSDPNMFAPYITSDYMAANILIRSRLVGSTETNMAIARIEAKAKELFKQPVRVIKKPDKAVTQAPVPLQKGEEFISWDMENDVSQEEIIEFEIDWDDVDAEPEDAVDADTAAPDQPKELELETEQADDPYAHLPAPSPEDFPWPSVDVHVTGTIYLMNKSADAVSKGQVTGLFTALLAIFIIMSLLFLSPKIGFLAMLPNLFPIIILFGVMGFFGITLNFSTSLIAAIALGIGVDDTIQYINRYNIEIQKSRDQTKAMLSSLKIMGKPMMYTSTALFFGFIILAFSDFVPIKQFGVLTASVMLVALLSNLVILPALLITVRITTLWDLIDLEIGDNPARYIKIFNGLSNHQAKVAVLNGNTMEFADGEYIILEGEMGNEMFVLLKGVVEITKGEGEDEVVLFEIQPGDEFGEMALLRHTTRSASARAVGDVKLFVFDEQILYHLQKRYPRISANIYYNLSQILSDRLQSTTSRIYESNKK